MLLKGMLGPMVFHPKVIDTFLESRPGVYALGHCEDEEFVIQCIGRADEDLRGLLFYFNDEGKYEDFYFDYSDSPVGAFQKECRLFHLNEHDKDRMEALLKHPTPPRGTYCQCPVCVDRSKS